MIPALQKRITDTIATLQTQLVGYRPPLPTQLTFVQQDASKAGAGDADEIAKAAEAIEKATTAKTNT
jgi:hypothetical protein